MENHFTKFERMFAEFIGKPIKNTQSTTDTVFSACLQKKNAGLALEFLFERNLEIVTCYLQTSND